MDLENFANKRDVTIASHADIETDRDDPPLDSTALLAHRGLDKVPGQGAASDLDKDLERAYEKCEQKHKHERSREKCRKKARRRQCEGRKKKCCTLGVVFEPMWACCLAKCKLPK